MSSIERNPNESIQVYIRCRGLLECEKNHKLCLEVHPGVNKIIVRDSGVYKTFSFDKVFGPETRQEVLYQEVGSPIIQEVLRGFNCTIIAYGQTGTGKTFTIVGDRTRNLDVGVPDTCPGIIPRAMKDLFDRLQEKNLGFQISVSFLELYNEEIFDLLAKSEDLIKLKMFDNAFQNCSVIHGLQVIPVNCIEDVYTILDRGCKRRHRAATLLNEMSSRSHTIFTANVNIKEKFTTTEKSIIVKLNMVDLAGSENIGRSGAVDKRAREAGNINQSLLALSRVITSLCQNTKHIPYRQSKLTRLLRDSLGGQTKTTIIATISPSIFHLDETLNTLKYALRAKNVMNKPEVNSEVSTTSLTKDYLEKICELKKTLTSLRSENGYYVNADNWRNLSQKSTAAVEEKFKILAEIEEITKETASVDIAIAQAEQDISMLTKKLEEKQEEKKNLIKEVQREKADLAVNEFVLAILKKFSCVLHDQLHEGLAKQYEIQTEYKKVKEEMLQKISERKLLSEKLQKLHSSRFKSFEYLKDFKKSVLKGSTEVQEHVNYLTNECKSFINQLQKQLDEYYNYYEKGFSDVSSLMTTLEKENVSFCERLKALSEEQKYLNIEWLNTCGEEKGRNNLNITDFGTFEDILNAFERNLSVIFVSLKDWKECLHNKLKEREQFLHSCLDDQMNLMQTLRKKTSYLMKNLSDAYDGYSIIVSDALNHVVVKKNWEEHIVAVENLVCSLETFCNKNMEEEFEKQLSAHLKLEGFTDIGMKVSSNMLEFCDSSVKAFSDLQKNLESRNLSDVFSKDVQKLNDAALVSCKNLDHESSRLTTVTKNFKELDNNSKLVDEESHSKDVCIKTYCSELLKHNDSIENTFKKLRTDMKDFSSEQGALVEKLKSSSSRNFDTHKSFLLKHICSMETDLPKRLEQLGFSKDPDAWSQGNPKNQDEEQIMNTSEIMMASNDVACQKNCPFCNSLFDGERFAGYPYPMCIPETKNEETFTIQSTELTSFGLEGSALQSISEVQKNVKKTEKVLRKCQHVSDIEDEILSFLLMKEGLSDEET